MKEDRKQEIIASLKLCVDLNGEDLELYFKNLHKIGESLADERIILNLGKFFNTLGNDIRLKILKLLMQKDYCVCELEVILDKSQSSISHHLKLLESEGLIRGIKKGYFTHYELIHEKFKKSLTLFKEYYPFTQ
ncbi:MAG: ArsR/SmtB family transcription factor [Promethearchaeota archaeon]